MIKKNVHTLDNLRSEGCSITYIFVFYPCIVFYLVFCLICFTVPYSLYLRNSVTWLSISINLFIPFL